MTASSKRSLLIGLGATLPVVVIISVWEYNIFRWLGDVVSGGGLPVNILRGLPDIGLGEA